MKHYRSIVTILASAAAILIGAEHGSATPDNSKQAPDSVVPQDRQMSDFEMRLSKARLLTYGKSRLAEAAGLYESLLTEQPDDPDLTGELGALYMRLERFDRALPLLRSTAAKRPDDYKALVGIARCELLLGRVEGSLPLFQSLAARFPSESETFLYLSRVYSSLRKHKEAVISAERYAALRGRNEASALAALGDAHFAAGNFDQAVTFLERALAQSSANEDTKMVLNLRRNLALALSYSGREDRALEHLTEVGKQLPSDVDILLARARVLAHRDQASAALPYLTSAIDLSRNNPVALTEAADVYVALGHYERAMKLYRELVDSHPEDETLALRFADRSRSWGDFDTAEKIYSSRLSRSPDDVEVRRKLAEVLSSSDRIEEAESVFRSISLDEQADRLQREPENIETQASKEFARIGIENASKDEFVTQLTESNATNPRILSEWSEVFLENRRSDLALRLVLAALTSDPDFTPAQFLSPEVLIARGSYSEAVAAYRRLLDIFPANFKLSTGLGRALAFDRNYRESVSVFEGVYRTNPGNYPALREAARAAMWGKETGLARSLYQRLERIGSDDTVRRSGIERFQQSAALEAEAKLLFKNRQPTAARATYDRLLHIDPRNKEALFDRAQLDCSQGRVVEAVSSYDRLIALDPLHKTAPEAKAQLMERRTPALLAGAFGRTEEGRGELTRFSRYEFDTGFETPIGDDTTVSVAARAWREKPGGTGETYESYGPMLAVSSKLSPRLRTAARWSERFYDDELSSRHLGAASVAYQASDALELSLGYERSDEIYNRFGLERGLQSDNIVLSSKGFLTPETEVSGMYRHTEYTDSNRGEFVSVAVARALSEEPRVFKLGLASEYRNTTEDNIFIVGENGTTDIIHPYWSPHEYSATSLTFDWTHELTQQVFCAQRRHYYRILTAPYLATDGNAGVNLSFEWGIELPGNFGFGVKGGIERSQLYDAEQGVAFARIGF